VSAGVSDRSTALARPVPVAAKLARTLDEAGPDALVVIDRRGDLIPLGRLRALSLASRAAGFTLFALTAFFMFQALGGIGLALPVGLALWQAARRARWSAQWRVAALIQAGRLDEAEALCEALARRPGGRQGRVWLHRNRSVIASRRGRHDLALDETRAALKRAAGRDDAAIELLALQEIRLLCDVGRVGEARARLDGRSAPSRGEVVIVQRWLTEQYVQFHENRPALDEDELWRRAQRALKLSGGAPLLALCAWAYVARRDDDMAEHLTGEAADRFVPWMKRASPSLWRFVEERLGRALPDGAEGEAGEP